MTRTLLIILCTVGLVLVIGILALVGSLNQNKNALNKIGLLYFILIAFLNALVLFAITFLYEDSFLINCFFAFTFLVFGIIHNLRVHTQFETSESGQKGVHIVAEILFSFGYIFLVCLLFMVSEFFLRDRQFLFYPILLSSILFLAPLLFIYTLEYINTIPPADFPVWVYPLTRRLDPPDESSDENVYVIEFNIAKSPHSEKSIFRAKAPENIILGDLFYHFINEYNDQKGETPIEFLSPQKDPYIWWFHLKKNKIGWSQVLNPNLRIRDNKIKENAVIVCERV